MVFLGNLTVINATKSQVGLVHNMPFDSVNGMGKTEAELNAMGILVDSVPDPQPPAGQVVSGMFVDPTTKQVFYEYMDRPLTQEEQLAKANDQIALMQKALDSIILGV